MVSKQFLKIKIVTIHQYIDKISTINETNRKRIDLILSALLLVFTSYVVL